MPRRRKKRSLETAGKWWSESQKIEAVTTWLALGNLAQSAAVLDIPIATIKRWRYSDWWKKIEEDLRQEESLGLNARLKKVISKALDVTEDRLSNGNYQFNQKTGELVRVPVNIKDASRVANDMMNRSDIIEEKPIQQQIEKTVDDRLAKLAEDFKRFATAKEVKSEHLTIDMVK